MNGKLGNESSIPPVESVFSYEIVEQNRMLLYEVKMTTMDETKIDMETALAWGVSAKNRLRKINICSPNQLGFHVNVNIPLIVKYLELHPSGFVRKKLEVWHQVQYNHIKAESIERIKRTLRRQARKKSEESYETVYYKRRATNGWRVQVKVPWKEGNFVLISYDAASYQRITS